MDKRFCVDNKHNIACYVLVCVLRILQSKQTERIKFRVTEWLRLERPMEVIWSTLSAKAEIPRTRCPCSGTFWTSSRSFHSLVNLFHCSVTHTVKCFLMFRLAPSVFQSVLIGSWHWALLIWTCSPCTLPSGVHRHWYGFPWALLFVGLLEVLVGPPLQPNTWQKKTVCSHCLV